MSDWLQVNYTGAPFELFGTAHLVALGIIVLINLSFIAVRRNPNPFLRVFIRYALVATILLSELAWQSWNWVVGQWTLQATLPLHLCSLFIVITPLLLITKNYRVYEFAYFVGIGGASQAVLTPDLGIYGYPHFRFFQVLIAHAAIVTASIYMTVVEGYRPHWSSLRRTLITLGTYAFCIFFVNLAIGSNFLFLMHKPATASLMDYLGPWPLYLLPLVGIAIGVFVLLYLPFAISDWQTQRRAANPI